MMHEPGAEQAVYVVDSLLEPLPEVHAPEPLAGPAVVHGDGVVIQLRYEVDIGGIAVLCPALDPANSPSIRGR